MAKIRYNNNGVWTTVSAADVGADSTNIISRGVGEPNDLSSTVTQDTILYIDKSDYKGNDTNITRIDSSGIPDPLPISRGGTEAKTLNGIFQSIIKPSLDPDNNSTYTVWTQALGNILYPVGSIYISTENADPTTLFGGTWERIYDTFLLAGGNDYPAGSSGGQASFIITPDEIPLKAHSHGAGSYATPKLTHTVTQPTFNMPAHSHTLANSFVVFKGSGLGNGLGASGGAYGTNISAGSFKHLNTYSHASASCSRTTNVGVAEHAAKAITGSSEEKSAAATVSHNNMPPYLAVYVWKRKTLASIE